MNEKETKRYCKKCGNPIASDTKGNLCLNCKKKELKLFVK